MSDFVRILESNIMVLPKIQKDEDNYFPNYVEQFLNEYITLLEAYGVENHKIVVIKDFIKNIKNSINSYYLGQQALAYRELDKAMQVKGYDISKNIVCIDDVQYYRARVNDVSNASEEFSIDKMFHVPFELRTKIQTQRYSIAGLPCLYLGESTYVCWLEMGKPNLDSLNIALIEQQDSARNLRIIDLSLTPLHVKQGFLEHKYDYEFVDEYLKFYPLIALCSIVVKDKSGAFKPEYIIPQLLMQWIREDRRRSFTVDGIKYFTVNINTISEVEKFNTLYLNYPRLFLNIVIPVQETKERGYCQKLSGSFIVKQTISGKSLQFVKDNNVLFGSINPEEYENSAEKIILGNGSEVLYEKTLFSTFESFLKGTINNGGVYVQTE